MKLVANTLRSTSFGVSLVLPTAQLRVIRTCSIGVDAFPYIAKEMVMAFSFTNSKGATYILHSQTTTLKNGNSQTIFFFAKAEKEGALDAVPGGYEVSESKNGLPVLKRSNK